MPLILPIALALASALAFAAASVGQQHAAASAPDEYSRGLRFVLQLLRNPRWIAATLGNAVGYGLQAAALGVGSVVVVQPILVCSLLFALPLGARLAHQRLPSAAVVSALLLTVSLAMFLIIGNTDKGLSRGSFGGWVVVAIIGVPVVVGCLLLARARSGSFRAAMLAVAVGVLGGVLAILTKSVVDAAPSGALHLLTTGETYGLVVVGLVGIYLQQLSFQAGTLRSSLPIMTVLEPVIAAALGLTLLHEQLHANGMRAPLLIGIAVVMAVATFVLASAHLNRAERCGELTPVTSTAEACGDVRVTRRVRVTSNVEAVADSAP